MDFPPSNTYQEPQVRQSYNSTLSDDDISSYYLNYSSSQLSPSYNDDFPTPKGNLQRNNVPAPIQTQPFDELYDVSDAESESFPLTASQSVRVVASKMTTPLFPQTPKGPKRFPSIVIPSPSAWPTIQKYQKKAAAGLQQSPMPQITSPTPDALAKFVARTLRVPSRIATPSLDGSMTSEELSENSCPPTPDQDCTQSENGEWSAGPVQLHPDALSTLHRLSGEELEVASLNEAIEASREEMQEVAPVNITVTRTADDEAEPISAISIPSPGGFFSSLDASTRNTWRVFDKEEIPSTSVAESFYNLPWETEKSSADLPLAQPAGPDKIVRQTIEIDSAYGTASDGPSIAKRVLSPEAPITAIRITSPVSDVSQVAEIALCEYNENYPKELEQASAAHLDRTSEWLSAQISYLSNLLEKPAEAKPEGHARKDSGASSGASSGISRSKSVRFADVVPESPKAESEDMEEEKEREKEDSKEATFFEGFRFIREKTHQNDAWTHRRERAEALQLDRVCLVSSHCEQLMGKVHLNTPKRVAPPRPVSCFYSADPSVQKEQIELAQKERQALDQLKPVSWNIEATKLLNGGGLLTSPTGKAFSKIQSGRVLDLGGQATCDWAWEVACQYPKSAVYTVYSADQQPTMNLEGPANHRAQVVPNLWTLPYPKNHFDVISARSLYAILKTEKPLGKKLDEYDLCLKECIRCLKPGGYLEYTLLDADILRAERQVSALAVEFCFSLRTRGYDPYPTKSFLPRLRKAGFGEMKRAWLVLPMAQVSGRTVPKTSFDVEDLLPRPSIDATLAQTEMGSTADASFIAGMVGAWAWEKWMLKLQIEMGKEEERLLEGVASALEEGAGSGAAWRYLSGWARKPF